MDGFKCICPPQWTGKTCQIGKYRLWVYGIENEQLKNWPVEVLTLEASLIAGFALWGRFLSRPNGQLQLA